ncbi:MAG: hypothetical protein IPK83_00845 [Planctomycetes bacterium]|nr:hypothetical protein [Planctomycetota bacterium]
MRRLFYSTILTFIVPLLGCSSGTIDGVHATSKALVVRDMEYGQLCIVTKNGVKRIPHSGPGVMSVAPMTQDSQWLVINKSVLAPHWIPFTPKDPRTTRLLLPAIDSEFTFFDLATNSQGRIPHNFDSDDYQIYGGAVFENRFWVEQSARVRDSAKPIPNRYHCYDFAKRTWTETDLRHWEEAKTAANSWVDATGLSQGKVVEVPNWGTLRTTGGENNRQTYLRQNNGTEICLFNQNDLRLNPATQNAIRSASGPIYP